eukprot:185046_1
MAVLCSIRTILFLLDLRYSFGTGSSILVQNAGFETDNNGAVPDETYVYGDPIISHWEKYNPNLMLLVGSVGIENPTSSTAYDDSQFGTNPPEGNQCAYTDQQPIRHNSDGEFGIYQTLTGNVVTGDTTYTLKVFVGNEAVRYTKTLSPCFSYNWSISRNES